MPKPVACAVAIEELSRLLKSAAREIDLLAAEHLEGLTVPRWHVLAALDGDVGQPMSALAWVTGLPGPSVTRLIDGMVDDNLVLRKADVVDRRRVLVYHTRRGSATYQRIHSRLSTGRRLDSVIARHGALTTELTELLSMARESSQTAEV